MKTGYVVAFVAALSASAVAARAQPVRIPGGNPGLLPPGGLALFGQPGYRGSSVVLRGPTPSLTPWGFGDKAKSLQVRGHGRWQVCTKVNYGGRCEIIGDSIYDLATWRLRDQISSARPVGR